MDNKSDAELREIRRLRRERLNEENISRQQLQEQMDIFQQQRDLFLRRQRQARETSAAEIKSTALTEGLENNGDRQETSTASIGVEQRSGMSDSRAVQSTNAQRRGDNISGVHSVSDSRSVQSTNVCERRESITRSHYLSDDRVVQSTINQPSGENTSGVHSMSDSRAVQSTNAQERRQSIDRSHNISPNEFDTIEREIQELDRRLLEHRRSRSNEKEPYSGLPYHNRRKESSNPKNREEGSKDRTSNVSNATKGLFPTRISVDGKANSKEIAFENQKGVSASSMTKQNPQHPVRKDIENTADYEDDLNSGKEYPDQIKRRLDFKHSVDYTDTPSVVKEIHTTDTRDDLKQSEMPDSRFSKHENKRESLHLMDGRERKSNMTDAMQMPSDEYKMMMDLKRDYIRDRERDELGVYGRDTPNASVGFREPPYRAFYENPFGDSMGLSGYKEYPRRINPHPYKYDDCYDNYPRQYYEELQEAKHKIKLDEERSYSYLRELGRQKLEEIRENRQLLILNRNKEDELRKRENKLRDLEERMLKMEAHFNSANDQNQTEDEVKLLEDEQYHLLIRQQELQEIEKEKDHLHSIANETANREKELSRKEEYLKKMEGELLEKEEGLRRQIQSGLPIEAIDKVTKEKKAQVTHFVKPYITPFSGMEPVQKNECSFEDWKLEIQCLIQSAAYPDYIVAQCIRNSLKVPAKRAIVTLGSSVTSQELIEKLQNVFGNVASGESVLTEFYTSSQQPTESVTMWGLRLEEIVQRGIEKGQISEGQKDEMLRTRFWRNLYDKELQNATRVYYDQIKEFDKLRTKVRSEEYWSLKPSTEKNTTSKVVINTPAPEKKEEVKSEPQAQHQPLQLDPNTSALKEVVRRLEKIEKQLNSKRNRWRRPNYNNNNQRSNTGNQQEHPNDNANKNKKDTESSKKDTLNK